MRLPYPAAISYYVFLYDWMEKSTFTGRKLWRGFAVTGSSKIKDLGKALDVTHSPSYAGKTDMRGEGLPKY